LRVRTPDIRVHFTDRIERDLKAMGKLKLVKSEIPPQEP
jgi:hypothetical protein